MHFFLHEVIARLVAIYLLIDSSRQLRRGLVERKIAIFNPDYLSWLLGWSNRIVNRDAEPIGYWIQIGIHIFIGASCLVVAIFGWLQSKT